MDCFLFRLDFRRFRKMIPAIIIARISKSRILPILIPIIIGVLYDSKKIIFNFQGNIK